MCLDKLFLGWQTERILRRLDARLGYPPGGDLWPLQRNTPQDTPAPAAKCSTHR